MTTLLLLTILGVFAYIAKGVYKFHYVSSLFPSVFPSNVMSVHSSVRPTVYPSIHLSAHISVTPMGRITVEFSFGELLGK
jgi:hypothetical protein